jgi:hypothetical protein
MTRRPATAKPPLEREIQKGIIQYLRAGGWTVWNLSQGYRGAPGGTRQSPGLPDLYAVHPTYGAAWLEIKRGQLGRMSPAQQAFATAHHREPSPPVFVMRSLEEVRSVWRDMGWNREAAGA